MAPYAHAVFCDDIRPELFGKYSLMGVFGYEILVPQAPIILPRVGLALWVSTPASKPFKKINVRVLFEKKVVFENNSEVSYLENMPPKRVARDMRMMTQNQFILSSLTISGPGSLKVRVRLDDGPELKAGALNIVVSADQFEKLTQQAQQPHLAPQS